MIRNGEKQGDTAVVVRLGHLGDVVLATGVLDWWKRTRNLSFVFITRPGNADVLEEHPAVREIVEVDPSGMSLRAWIAQCNRISRGYHGLPLIDLHGVLRTRVLAQCWRGRVFRYPKKGLLRRLYGATRMRPFARALEETNVPQRYAMALDKAPPGRIELLPKIHLNDGDRYAALGVLKGIDGPPLVALHPYATHPAKQWPAEYWEELANQLELAGINWVCIGRNDVPLFSETPRDLTNRTGLRQTCAVLERASVLVTNDSGPLHLAAGVRTPVVALFGPTAPAWGFYPAGRNDMVLERPLKCRPCSLHGKRGCANGLECLASITPHEAMVAVKNILSS